MIQPNYIYQPAFNYEEPVASPPSSKTKKLLLYMLLALPILFLLTTLILFIFFLFPLAHQPSAPTLTSSVTVSSQLKSDLSLPLIKSLASGTGDCISPLKNLLLGEFPGVEKGCLCKDGSVWVLSDDSKCTDSSTTCKKGTGIESSSFKTLYNGKTICYSELPTNEYIYGTEAECREQSILNKHCGSGVCVADLDNCPINLAFIQSSQIANGVDLKADEVYLNYMNTFSLEPLIKLQLAYKPYCLNGISFPSLKSSTNYLLLGKQYTGCDQYEDYQYQSDAKLVEDSESLLSELDYKKTLELNSIPYSNNAKSPYYKDYINKYAEKDQWHLYQISRPKVGTSTICSTNKGFDNLKHVSNVGPSLLKPLFIFAIIGLVLSAIGLLLWIGLIVLSYIKKQSKKNANRMSQYLKLTHIIAILVALFIIFIFIYYMSTMSDEKEGIEQGQEGFSKALHANCYEHTKGFREAINVVQSFNNFIVDTAYPFIITFFILALIYLVLFSILSLICLTVGESPFLPPYAKGSYKH